MAVEVVQLKDLPVITKAVDVNMDDRVVVSHLFNSNTRASTSMTMTSLIDKIIFELINGVSNKRLHGHTIPASELGTNGDLYFKFTGETITETYVKYEGVWIKL